MKQKKGKSKSNNSKNAGLKNETIGNSTKSNNTCNETADIQGANKNSKNISKEIPIALKSIPISNGISAVPSSNGSSMPEKNENGILANGTVKVKKSKPNNKKNKLSKESTNNGNSIINQELKTPLTSVVPGDNIKSAELEPEKIKNKKKKKKKKLTSNAKEENSNVTTKENIQLNGVQQQTKNKKKKKKKSKKNQVNEEDTNEIQIDKDNTQETSIIDLNSSINDEMKFHRAVVFENEVNIKLLTEFLKQKMKITNESFCYRQLSRGMLWAAESNDMKILDLITYYLKKNKHGYFTYSAPEERKLLVVLQMPKGEYLLKDICKELVKLRIKFFNVSLFRSQWKPLHNYNLFLINIPRTTNLEELFEKNEILGVTAKWSEYKKKFIAQCRNCQRYGHVASNCHMPYRCVKCKDPHPVGKCKRKSQDDQSYCHNCESIGHPSNYRGCPVHKKRLELAKKNKAKNELNAALEVIALASKVMQM